MNASNIFKIVGDRAVLGEPVAKEGVEGERLKAEGEVQKLR
jgi:hypothetical protein